jgi:hypothetical protein
MGQDLNPDRFMVRDNTMGRGGFSCKAFGQPLTEIVSWMDSGTLKFIVVLFNNSHNKRSKHHE